MIRGHRKGQDLEHILKAASVGLFLMDNLGVEREIMELLLFMIMRTEDELVWGEITRTQFGV